MREPPTERIPRDVLARLVDLSTPRPAAVVRFEPPPPDDDDFTEEEAPSVISIAAASIQRPSLLVQILAVIDRPWEHVGRRLCHAGR